MKERIGLFLISCVFARYKTECFPSSIVEAVFDFEALVVGFGGSLPLQLRPIIFDNKGLEIK